MKLCVILILSVGFMAALPAAGLAHSGPQRASAQQTRRVGQPENRWRYVWHNDRWWYWAREGRWAYFDGRQWHKYDPRRAPFDALAAGYRKAPAFEKPPAAPPRPPVSWPGEAIGTAAGLVDVFDLGRATSGAGVPSITGALPPLGGFGRGAGVGGLEAGIGGRGGTSSSSAAGTTGGGGFGGPTGSSLGGGSAVGGASTPQ